MLRSALDHKTLVAIIALANVSVLPEHFGKQQLLSMLFGKASETAQRAIVEQ